MRATSRGIGAVDPRRPTLPWRLGRFVVERFPPLSFGILVLAMVLCGRASAALSSGTQLGSAWEIALVALSVGLAFLQLRILDEIRDEAVDRAGRPERPLPRGLVSVRDLQAFAASAALVGLAIAASLGGVAMALYGIALAVIWALGLDLPGRLSIHLGIGATALVHSVVAPVVLVFIWASQAPPAPRGPLAAAALLAWGASLALEVARKTVQSVEERPAIETYSGAFGRPLAVRLAAMAVAAAWMGAGAVAQTVGAPTAAVIGPFLIAAAVLLMGRIAGDRISTTTLRVGSTVLVIAALLWPLAISWLR